MQHHNGFQPSPFVNEALPKESPLTEPSPFVDTHRSNVSVNNHANLHTSTQVNWIDFGKSLPPLVPKHTKQVMIKKLCITDVQRKQINEIYEGGSHFMQDYAETGQQDANAMLLELALDQDSRKGLESRWSVRNSTKSKDGQRILFQCGCGYDSKARQKQEDARNAKQGSSKEWERQAPYPFTACLAHIEIIEKGNGVVTWIAGVPDHNEACKASFLERRPPVPLHEHVYEIALDQLKDGASITAIQDKNRQMMASKLYRGMESYDPLTANVRYLFLPSDHASLYRKATKGVGVDSRQLPQNNVEDWLNPKSPNYKPDIAEAVFHYSARVEADDRFEICISTPEMDEAAWKYAHQSQFILDGTFGICSSRLLLFIALAIDEDRKGIPIALFLFSASTKAKATHVSYDTSILTRLLTAWKSSLTRKFKSFEPFSCITDTDTKERGAIIAVWPHIILLICKFHLRQCWTNNRKKLFRFNGPEYWKDLVRNNLYTLEVQLISSVEHDSAMSLVQTQRMFLQGISAVHQEGKRSADAGIEHLRYLEGYWLKLSLWQSWSEWGRLAAAAAIKIPVEGIIPTTNHLESFNMVLKKKYIEQHLRSGHRLRFDLLIALLITDILPKVYSRRRAMREHTSWLDTRFFKGAGAQNLSELQAKLVASRQEQACILRSVCWWSTNAKQDAQARDILQLQRLHSFTNGSSPYTFAALCTSSHLNAVYSLTLSRSGEGSCSCPHFYNEGGACKHLRAFRFLIDSWVSRGICLPFYYPPSLSAAHDIQSNTQGQVCNTSDITPPPLIPTKNDTLESWANLQALGEDPTIFGGPNDEEDAEPFTRGGDLNANDEDSYSESGGDNGDVTWPGVYADQREAVDAQISYRVNEEISTLLPRLHGLDALMKDATGSLDASSNLFELEQVLSRLLRQISFHTQLGENTPMTESTSLQNIRVTTTKDSDTTHHTVPRKRRTYERAQIRAPSPEEKQRRKKSHGIL